MASLFGKKEEGPQGPTGAKSWIAKNEERKAAAEAKKAEAAEMKSKIRRS